MGNSVESAIDVLSQETMARALPLAVSPGWQLYASRPRAVAIAGSALLGAATSSRPPRRELV